MPDDTHTSTLAGQVWRVIGASASDINTHPRRVEHYLTPGGTASPAQPPTTIYLGSKSHLP